MNLIGKKILRLLIAAGFVAPLLYLLGAVLNDWSGIEFLLTGRFYWVLLNTFLLMLAVLAASVPLGMFLGYVLARKNFPGRRMWEVVLPLGFVVPSYVFAFVFLSLRISLIDGFLGAWLVLVLITFPYVLLNVKVALQSADPVLEDAARVLGKGRWEIFRTVTLPLMKPAMISSSLLVGLYVLSDFGAVSLFNVNTLTREIYFQFTSSFDRGRAVLLAGVLMFLSTGVLAFSLGNQLGWRSKAKRRMSDLQRQSLGRWKWLVSGVCGMMAMMAIGFPLMVLGWWLVRGLMNGVAVQSQFGFLVNSVGYALGAAVVSLILVGVAVWLIGRRSSWSNRVLETVIYLGYGTPGIVVALIFVMMVLQFMPVLYQGYLVLLVAYVFHFAAQAFGAVKQSFCQLNPHFLESAATLGKSRFEAWKDIGMPLMKKGLFAGGILVFLSVMRELPITLLLAPIGFDTLATHIWAATDEAFFTEAALSGIILITISLIGSLAISHE